MDLVTSIGYAAVYSVAGAAVLCLGYLVLDLVTPGRLGSHIYVERSVNAGIVLAAAFVGLGLIVFTAIWTNGVNGLGSALGWTLAFGVLGVLLQGLAFRLLDAMTPGDMAAMVVEPDFHPASIVAAAAHLAISLVVVASIA